MMKNIVVFFCVFVLSLSGRSFGQVYNGTEYPNSVFPGRGNPIGSGFEDQYKFPVIDQNDPFAYFNSLSNGTYTADERKYVQADDYIMDSELPPVMRVLEMRSAATGEVFCSATAFSGFIITALHCLLGDDGKLVDPSDIYFTIVDKNVSFKSEFRNFYYVTSASFDSEENLKDLSEVGNEVDNESFEDWALIIPSGEQNEDATVLAALDDQISGVMLYDGTDENAISIGYGSLQILSDQQIDFIKQQWAQYLSEHRIYEDVGVKPKVVSTINPEGISFLSEIENYGVPKSIFKDMYMKYSRCKLDGGEPYQCQAWGGDSGGPVFVQSKDDNKWLYYAIRSMGPSSIGAESGTPSREWTHNGGVTYASVFWDRVKVFFNKKSNSYSYWMYHIHYDNNFERRRDE